MAQEGARERTFEGVAKMMRMEEVHDAKALSGKTIQNVERRKKEKEEKSSWFNSIEPRYEENANALALVYEVFKFQPGYSRSHRRSRQLIFYVGINCKINGIHTSYDSF